MPRSAACSLLPARHGAPSLDGRQQQQGLVDAKLGDEDGEDREHDVLNRADPLDEACRSRVEHHSSHAIAPERGAEHDPIERQQDGENHARGVLEGARQLLGQVLLGRAEPQESARVHHVHGDERHDRQGNGVHIGHKLGEETNPREYHAEDQEQRPPLGDRLGDGPAVAADPVADVHVQHAVAGEVAAAHQDGVDRQRRGDVEELGGPPYVGEAEEEHLVGSHALVHPVPAGCRDHQ
mmetsp:Transcript_3676/g.9272  ORF Transcript_3676/g.9272 Transcript_3676/m.9272 type:complete len:238 (-) Transcript_3676:122-835(-)